MTDIKQPPSARIHPNERGRVEAINSIDRHLHGVPQEKLPTSYYTPLLIQCTLPHSDPKVRDWKKTNGDFTLVVSSGLDNRLEPYGIPYGSFPRLSLAYIITEVQASKQRRVELGASFGSYLKKVGYTGNLRGVTRASQLLQNQLMRLLKSNISFDYAEGNAEQGSHISGRLDVADTIALWWDYKQPEQGSLWGSYIELSEKFHEAILKSPVPLRTDILAALKKSPLALDTYMWVSYRLFTMQASGQESVTLSYGRLQEQFGTGVSEANYRSFRRDFKNSLSKVAQYWQAPDGATQRLNYELHEEGMTLFRSPLLIPVPRRKLLEKEATAETQRILRDRAFDTITLKQARQIANGWDVRWLSNQYFDWIEKEEIVPIELRAHFLAFIRKHVERNGKPS